MQRNTKKQNVESELIAQFIAQGHAVKQCEKYKKTPRKKIRTKE